MPAVALTDHGSLGGSVQFYRAAQKAERQSDPRDRALRRQRPPRPRRHEGALRAPHAAGARPPRAIATWSSSRRSPSSRATTTSRAPTGSCSRSTATASSPDRLHERSRFAAVCARATTSRRWPRSSAWSSCSAARTSTSRSRTPASDRAARAASEARAARPPGRPQDGGDQRRPLPAPRRRPHAGRAGLHPDQCQLDEPKSAPRMSTEQFYLKTADEMRELFRDYPEACDATLEIAERCHVELEFGNILLPSYRVPDGFAGEDDYLRSALRCRASGGATAPPPAPRSPSASISSSESSGRWASPPTS